MPELVDRSIVSQRLCAACSNTGSFACISCAMPEIVKGIPKIEAEPVRHGLWVELPKALNDDEEPCKCSVCGHCLSFYNHYPKSKFCPNCGARMDGGADNG